MTQPDLPVCWIEPHRLPIIKPIALLLICLTRAANANSTAMKSAEDIFASEGSRQGLMVHGLCSDEKYRRLIKCVSLFCAVHNDLPGAAEAAVGHICLRPEDWTKINAMYQHPPVAVIRRYPDVAAVLPMLTWMEVRHDERMRSMGVVIDNIFNTEAQSDPTFGELMSRTSFRHAVRYAVRWRLATPLHQSGADSALQSMAPADCAIWRIFQQYVNHVGGSLHPSDDPRPMVDRNELQIRLMNSRITSLNEVQPGEKYFTAKAWGGSALTISTFVVIRRQSPYHANIFNVTLQDSGEAANECMASTAIIDAHSTDKAPATGSFAVTFKYDRDTFVMLTQYACERTSTDAATVLLALHN